MQPTLHTARLILRPFNMQDAREVQRLAGDVRIADGTTAVPHPYPDGAAETWIGGHQASFDARREIIFAITMRDAGDLIGAVSLLNISAQHARAELGFWVGVEYWSRGYCTEAVREIMRFGEESLAITRFVGRCLGWNLASAAVMKKAGLQAEGHLVKHELRGATYVDQLLFGRVLPGRSTNT